MNSNEMSPNRENRGGIGQYTIGVNLDLSHLAFDIFEIKSEIRGLIHNTKQIEELLRNMASRAELAKAIGDLNDTLVSEVVEIKAVVKSLEEKIAELSVPDDFSDEINRLKGVADAIAEIVPSAPSAPVTPEVIEEVIAAPAEEPTEESPALTSDDLGTVDEAPVEPMFQAPIPSPDVIAGDVAAQ